MVYGTLQVNLKGSKVEIVEPKTWLQKFARIFTGQKSLKKQVVTQMQYLENIANVFEGMGWKNVTMVEVNGKTVYEDDAYTPDDLRKAIELAMAEAPKDIYHVEIDFQNIDKSAEEEYDESITVDMYSQEEPDSYPLTITVDLARDSAATEAFLNEVVAKLNEKFGVEDDESIEVDEDDNEIDEEDEDTGEEETTEDEDSSEPETEAAKPEEVKA